MKGVDCWGLLRLVYHAEFGIELPEIHEISQASVVGRHVAITQAASRDWAKIAEPKDGVAIAMSQIRYVHHVGVWVAADGGKVLHSWGEQGVVVDTRKRLRLRGIYTLEFYQHLLWPSSL